MITAAGEVPSVLYLDKKKWRVRRWALSAKDGQSFGELDWTWVARGTPAQASAAGTEWAFKQAGGHRSGLGERYKGTTLAIGHAGNEVARFTWAKDAPGAHRGELARPGWPSLTLKGPLQPLHQGRKLKGFVAWHLIDDGGDRWVDCTFKVVNGIAAERIVIDVHPPARSDPDALLLILLSCHLVQRINVYSDSAWSWNLG